MKTINVDLSLIEKYGGQGPRYTSYPTALKFEETFASDRLISDLESSAFKPQELSLYYHLPFCESMCWFCGCTTIISKDHAKLGPYLDYLDKEMDLYAPYIHPESKVSQMHFGGGTPNYLDPNQIDRVGQSIRKRFSFDEEAELSVELDPRRLTREHIAAFARMGVNRASFGVQDLNPEVQEAVNRIQPEEMCLEAIEWIRSEGFKSLNIDLIYGLPFQTRESFLQTIERVVEWNPDRFAIFNYAHVPWMKPGQKMISESDMPKPEEKLLMLKMITEYLTSHGYEYIGMDHFAKADDELAIAQRNKTLQRNFQGYSTKAGANIYAFGLSSISQTRTHYRQNCKTLPSYYQALDNNKLPFAKAYFLSHDDRIRRTVIMRLMCDLELDYEALSRQLDIDFKDYFSKELQRFEEADDDGIVNLAENRLEVTELGRLLVRNLAMRFDAYLGEGVKRFSKTI